MEIFDLVILMQKIDLYSLGNKPRIQYCPDNGLPGIQIRLITWKLMTKTMFNEGA